MKKNTYTSKRSFIKAFQEHREAIKEFSIVDLEEHCAECSAIVQEIHNEMLLFPENDKLHVAFRHNNARYAAARTTLKERKSIHNEAVYKSKLINTTNALKHIMLHHPELPWETYSKIYPNSVLEHILKNP